MDFITNNLANKLSDEISKNFISIIDEIAGKTEISINQTLLKTIGREKYSKYINDRIGTFPLFGTSFSANVDDVYIKVNISREIEREKYRNISQIENLLKSQKHGTSRNNLENRSPVDLLNAINNDDNGFALLGNPGYGKTTAFRYLTVVSAGGTEIRGRKRIPIFLAVRDLIDMSDSILNASRNFFEWLDIGTPDKVLLGLLKEGRMVIFIDGLDETNHLHQKKLINEIEDLKAKYNKSVFCISSRPYALSIGLSGFTKWEVLPMKFEDRIDFINKWFSVISPEKGNRLISRSKTRPEILDLGSSPFFLSIVCALFYNDLDIPKEVNELYSRCVEGMLGGWDAFRNIARNTILKDYSLNRRKLIINWIAAHLFQNNKIVFTSEDLNDTHCLRKIASYLKSDEISSEEILLTLYNDFGILVERSPKIYSFSHLSIQEYCVAEYIIQNRQEISLLTNHKKNKEWQEIIYLVAKMLPNGDEFTKSFANSLNPQNENEIPLLLKISEANPICSDEAELFLLRKIAQIISSVTKFDIESFSYDSSVLEIQTTTINFVTQLQQALKKEKKKLRKEEKENTIGASECDDFEGNGISKKTPKSKSHLSSKYFIISYLPELVNIILKSKYDFDDIGFANNQFFRLLKNLKISHIEDIRVNFVAEN
jgi:predicted NACHT family NTPase